jgi:hypothetical protein
LIGVAVDVIVAAAFCGTGARAGHVVVAGIAGVAVTVGVGIVLGGVVVPGAVVHVIADPVVVLIPEWTGVSGVAQSIAVGIRAVVRRIVRAARAVVAPIGIHVAANELVLRVAVQRIVDAVVVVVRVTSVAQAVAVEIETVVRGVVVRQGTVVVRPDRAVVARVQVDVFADVGIERIGIGGVGDPVVVVVGIDDVV